MADDGHALAHLLVMLHGADRYPTPDSQFIKLIAELGELAEAMLTGDVEKIRHELGDVGHSLYLLGNKLDMNVIDAMSEIYTNEVRSLREGTLRSSKYVDVNIQEEWEPGEIGEGI